MTDVEKELGRLVDRTKDALIDVKHLVQVNAACQEENARLTERLATANEVIRQIAERFGVTDVRHILGELAEVQAVAERMRTALKSATENLIATNGFGEHECCCCGHASRLLETDIQHDPDCPVLDMRAALPREAVAGEAERQKEDPIRKPLDGMCYIQNTGYVGNSLLWWRENRCGYTCDISEALLVTEEEAKNICRDRPKEDIPHPAEIVRSVARLHVHTDELRNALTAAREALKGGE